MKSTASTIQSPARGGRRPSAAGARSASPTLALTRRLGWPSAALTALFIGLFSALPAAHAQVGRYVVELLVFQELGYSSVQPQPLASPQPTHYASAIGVVSARPGVPSASALVQRLPGNALHLVGARDALSGSGAYQPLMHLGWRQAAYDRETPEYVGVGEASSGPVFGTVALLHGRFLHVDLDLVYDSGVTRHRLRAGRKVQLGELMYFDHPAFGAIARVVRDD
ncbi:MAG: hypothetical protein KDK91_16295 [Gammaproteobacteria bacterium]|nr:hypothetical protein [Gammaproteobacteria bacterium]